MYKTIGMCEYYICINTQLGACVLVCFSAAHNRNATAETCYLQHVCK